MKAKLFAVLSDEAWGLCRLVFYVTIFLYYSIISPLGHVEWLTPEFRTFYQPISFFKLFNYSYLELFRSIDLFLVWKACLLLSAAGFLFPLSSLGSFLGLLLLAGIPLNFGKVHHSNHLPVMVLGIFALAINPGKYSLDNYIFKGWVRKLPVITMWPLQMSRIYMCLLYFSSGFQKVRTAGLEWVFSDNMQNIILTRPTVTQLGLLIGKYPILCQSMALVTVLAQLGAPLALLKGYHRVPIIVTLFFLHVGTYLVMGNHGFFFPYNLCFLVWLPWEKIVRRLKNFRPKFKFKLEWA